MQLGIGETTNLYINSGDLDRILNGKPVLFKDIDNISVGDIVTAIELTEHSDETGNKVTANIAVMSYLDEEDSYEITLEKIFYVTKRDAEGKTSRTHYMNLDKSVFSEMDYGDQIKGCIIFFDFKPNDYLNITLKKARVKDTTDRILYKIKAVYKVPSVDEVNLKVIKL